MAYKITKQSRKVCKDYGFKTSYDINFTFNKQKAKVTISQYPEDTQNYLKSETDGYHWLHFFLSQVPDAKEMIEYTPAQEKERCKELFDKHNIGFEPEDKETAFLSHSYKFDKNFVTLVAELIEPLFANRERFFP